MESMKLMKLFIFMPFMPSMVKGFGLRIAG